MIPGTVCSFAPHTFRYELRALDEKPICGFDILGQCRAWFHRVMGEPADIFDTKTGETYRIEPMELGREAVAGPNSFDGATMKNLCIIYGAGCCDPTYRDALAAVERALSSTRPEVGRAAIAAALMLRILHGDGR